MPTNVNPLEVRSPQVANPGADGALLRNVVLSIPLYVAVPCGFGWWLRRMGAPVRRNAFALGAVGWMAALAMRAPVALLAAKATDSGEQAQRWIVGSSGPLEEMTRLACLRLAGRDFASAASLGLGWASVEVVYTIANGLTVALILNKDDERAMQVKDALEAQGMESALSQTSPFLGAVERLSATSMHVGFTLLAARRPALMAVNVPVHSATNFTALKLVRRNPLLAEVAVGIAGAGLLAVGLAAFGKLRI